MLRAAKRGGRRCVGIQMGVRRVGWIWPEECGPDGCTPLPSVSTEGGPVHHKEPWNRFEYYCLRTNMVALVALLTMPTRDRHKQPESSQQRGYDSDVRHSGNSALSGEGLATGCATCSTLSSSVGLSTRSGWHVRRRDWGRTDITRAATHLPVCSSL